MAAGERAGDKETRADRLGPESAVRRHRALITVLLPTLHVARDRGFLGPGPPEVHVGHSLAFVAAWSRVRGTPPAAVLDLGSGGGLPGLVLAVAWPDVRLTLLDSSRRRTDFLVDAVGELGLASRVGVACGRAEELGRRDLRGRYDLVVARSFASPAVTAECGAPFVGRAGYLAIAEPPGGRAGRWPATGLAMLGLRDAGVVTEPAAVRLLAAVEPIDERYPRRTGIPAKRPLW